MCLRWVPAVYVSDNPSLELVMALPAQLLNAVSSPDGGKIAIVVGAGCSVEAPTCVPVEHDCSSEVHRRLVASGVLQNGDCTDPTDLSLVADAVFEKKQSQRDVVELLRDQYDLKLAPPNDGYRIAAAMLCEGAVSSMLTLNFDLALSNALSELGAGHMVGVIECPEDLPRQKNTNVYYLHRNVNEADPESWVLRTSALNEDWDKNWCQVVTIRALAAPVVVFAGIGSPARVLIESAKLIRTALPGEPKLFQIDPAERAVSKSFQELKLDPGNYIQRGWTHFMEELSERLSTEQVVELEKAIDLKVQEEEHLQTEDVANLLECLRNLGLVKFGKLRAHWLLYEKPYCPVNLNGNGLLADLLLALAMMARVSGAVGIILENGLVEFQRDGRVVVAYLVVSGRGHRGRAAVEAAVESRRVQYRSRPQPPRGVLVGGTSDPWNTSVTSPTDVARGDSSDDDIVTGPTALPLIHISELRSDSSRIHQVVP